MHRSELLKAEAQLEQKVLTVKSNMQKLHQGLTIFTKMKSKRIDFKNNSDPVGLFHVSVHHFYIQPAFSCSNFIFVCRTCCRQQKNRSCTAGFYAASIYFECEICAKSWIWIQCGHFLFQAAFIQYHKSNAALLQALAETFDREAAVITNLSHKSWTPFQAGLVGIKASQEALAASPSSVVTETAFVPS